MKRYCLALDLKDEERSIEAYEEYHKAIWPEVKISILDAGILDMEIYRAGNRLFMVMECSDDFDFGKKAAADVANPVVVKWEKLMSEYQQPIPVAGEGEKWVLMNRIFKLVE
ncbi:MAG: L-rhamnose mutarotase [Gemmatimonadaceae bacterium]|nr:L-rhamnose mutarotase [Chitinophagaceae bacterium]